MIKEAYEYFDRKYNPQKYANLRMPINKFDDAENNDKSGSKSNEAEKEYQSIRQKNKRRYTDSNNKDSEDKYSKYSFSFTFDERTNHFSNFDESREVFMDHKFKLDQYKKENIDKFLFTKAPVPRSHRMIG